MHQKGPPQDTPRVYSYVRFSTPEQASGRSEGRQLTGTRFARQYAAEQGFVFDETLHMSDRGFSGFDGSNRRKGALGKFLEAVELGKVPKQSVLIAENMDRLSREGPFTVLKDILFKLSDADITVLIRFPVQRILNKRNFDKELPAVVQEAQRAQGESDRKSELMTDVWEEKKRLAIDQGIVLTRKCPAWLKVIVDEKSGCQKYQPIEAAAETIRLIFQLYAVAGIGRSTLEKKLNREAKWMPPGRKKGSANGWRSSYVRKILENRAVLGEYQPHERHDGGRRACGKPRLNYYPQIVSPDLFQAAQVRIQKNRGKGGRTGKARNVFQNLVTCPYCNLEATRRSMVLDDKGSGPKGRRYLVCDNGRRSVLSADGKRPLCAKHNVRYDEFEETILDNCERLRPEDVLPSESERTRACEQLRVRITAAEHQQREIDRQVRNLASAIGKEDSSMIRDQLVANARELEAKKKPLDVQLRADRELLRVKEQSDKSFKVWQSDLKGLKAAIAPSDAVEAVEARLRLQAHLKEFIDEIEVFAVGFAGVVPRAATRSGRPYPKSAALSDDFEEWIDGVFEDNQVLVGSRQFRAFVKSVSQRRLTNEGRFFRIHFVNGGYVDVAPNDSLAFRWRFAGGERKAWEHVIPDLDALWNDFASRKRSTPRAAA